MNCEICGREVPKERVQVRIEGTLMKTCGNCARLGERVFSRPKTPAPVQQRHVARAPSPRASKVLDVVDDYARIVRQNREKLGLTQEQLGGKINEKGSVISRIESGHMEPDLKMAKKLERFLSVKLLEESEL